MGGGLWSVKDNQQKLIYDWSLSALHFTLFIHYDSLFRAKVSIKLRKVSGWGVVECKGQSAEAYI